MKCLLFNYSKRNGIKLVVDIFFHIYHIIQHHRCYNFIKIWPKKKIKKKKIITKRINFRHFNKINIIHTKHIILTILNAHTVFLVQFFFFLS